MNDRHTNLDRRKFVGACAAAACMSVTPLAHAMPAVASQTLSPQLRDLATQLAVQIERRQRHGEECGKLMARARGLRRWSKPWQENGFQMTKNVDALFDAISEVDALIERILPIQSARPADLAFQRQVLKLKAEPESECIWTSSYWKERKRLEALLPRGEWRHD